MDTDAGQRPQPPGHPPAAGRHRSDHRQARRSGAGGSDLLSILLHARNEEGDGGHMTDEQLRDEALTLLLAGHDTTANALTWTWYLLATHPDIAERVAVEVREVLGNRPPTAADLPRLTYAERIVGEGMRLYPPVYAFGREAVQDTEVMGHRIPRGWNVVMSQWVIQRDPRWFVEPERFDPDRWADGLAQASAALCLFPLRRRPAAVHRQRLRADGGGPDPGDGGAGVSFHDRSGPSRRADADGDVAAAQRHPGRAAAPSSAGCLTPLRLLGRLLRCSWCAARLFIIEEMRQRNE